MAHQVLVGHNGPTACLQNTEQNTTACLWHKPQTGCHKTVETT